MNPALDAVGQSYLDFLITEYLPLPELQSTLVKLVHCPTGARVLHIANQDPENLFCLSFQTFPDSSNGVAHILEHTVLCGSAKFPVKDPFFAMIRRSLNTFMNALTGQDFTCYPASSQVEKDFYNLLEVYLDAVFHPELKSLSFLQEGHRLEFAEPENPKSPLQFQGIVYNEMKGSLSSSDSRLWRKLFEHLMPDLPYSFNTGGDPAEIPNLSHEELIKFHQDFYHPSRCLFFFYGNLPLANHLEFISKRALQDIEKLAPLAPLPKQTRFSSPKTVSATYPIAASESLEKKTIIAFAFLTAPVIHQEEVLALTLLDSLLMDHDGSPLRQALLQSRLCTQAGSSIDPDMSEVPWVLVCKGCEAKDSKALKELLFKRLEELSKHPFPQEQIEASLHQLEFERTEINNEEGPFGLTLFMRSALLAQHGALPEQGLLVHTLFAALRAKLADPFYLPHLIQHYFLENPHFVHLTLEPDKELEAKEALEERKKLDQIRDALTPEEESKIIAQAKELVQYQEATEHQSLDCLPILALKDVPSHVRAFPLKTTNVGPLSLFHHSCFTNQILYADLVFDLPYIAQEDLPLASLLCRMLTEIGAAGRNYAENLAFAQAHTGGISANLSLHVQQENPDLCRPSLSLKGKALQRNASKLFELFADLIRAPHWDDRSRLKELLSQHVTSLRNRIQKNALNYAVQTALSPFSSASFVYDQWNGLAYFQTILKWAENPDALIDQLQRIAPSILGSKNPHLVLSCDTKQMEELSQGPLLHLSDLLPQKSLPAWESDYALPAICSQARLIAAPVAFTAFGMRTCSYQDPRAPFLFLAAELLQNTILHQEIREKGGAYGSQATYVPTTGNFYLYSFRDPNLTKTLATFQKSLDKIAAKQFKESHLEEAKLCVLQTLDAPVVPGQRAITAYSWKRAGRTDAAREEFRGNILEASREKIAQAVASALIPAEKTIVSFLGKELYDKEYKKLKTPLALLSIEDTPKQLEESGFWQGGSSEF